MKRQFTIEPAASLADLAELIFLHQTVIEKEMGMAVPPLYSRSIVMHLVARRAGFPGIVGALTIQETTDNRLLREQCKLPIPLAAKAACMTHMAVLPAYRG